MFRTHGWLLGGVVLLAAGVVLGVLITANYDLAPPSMARENPSGGGGYAGLAATGETSPFVAVVDQVLPAVVTVDTKRTVRRGPDPFQEMFRQFFGERRYREYFGDREPYQEFEIPGSASGFIFDDRGYILTNNHVVRGADEIEVTLSDGREFEAEVVGHDPSTDVAVIKIDGSELPTVRLGDSDAVRVGDWAIAIGNPLELEGTVTVGVVSALGRTNLNIRGGAPVYQDFIQTDASINFGNSGGPLVNIRGEVIGMNAATNVAAEGIGFAIPINIARRVADELVSEGKVVRGYLGVVPQPITRELAEAKDLDSTEGVIIASVENDTPADEAGLEPGDVVVEFGGVKITDVPQFRRVVAEFDPGDRVDIVVIRDGHEKKLRAKLAERPETAALGEEGPSGNGVWFGIEVVDLDDPIARRFDVSADEGVLVVSVESGSPAAHGGLEPGDVIVRIAGQDVRDLADYRKVMKGLEGRQKAFEVKVQRGAYPYFLAVKPE